MSDPKETPADWDNFRPGPGDEPPTGWSDPIKNPLIDESLFREAVRRLLYPPNDDE